MERVGWGILGCGSIATHAVAPAIGWSTNGELVAIASRDESVAREKARLLGADRSYAPYERLLEDPDVTAVYVANPNGLHEEPCLRAVSAGKHVLCEKSLAPSLDEARRMTAAAASRGVRLVEAFMYRHHPQWSVVRGFLQRGEVGEVQQVRAGLTGHAPPGDHRWSARMGGGALYDVVCYAVDVARFVLRAEPIAVTALSERRTEEEVDTATLALLEFPGGVGAFAAGSLRSFHEEYVTIVGSEGRVDVARPFVPGWAATTVTLDRRGDRRVIEVGGANHYLHMVEHFARLVLEPSLPPDPAESGLGNAVVLDAVARSAREGVRVAVGGMDRPKIGRTGPF
jgi:predicted dehydrogenase